MAKESGPISWIIFSFSLAILSVLWAGVLPPWLPSSVRRLCLPSLLLIFPALDRPNVSDRHYVCEPFSFLLFPPGDFCFPFFRCVFVLLQVKKILSVSPSYGSFAFLSFVANTGRTALSCNFWNHRKQVNYGSQKGPVFSKGTESITESNSVRHAARWHQICYSSNFETMIIRRIIDTVKPRNSGPKSNGNPPITNAKLWSLQAFFYFLQWQ